MQHAGESVSHMTQSSRKYLLLLIAAVVVIAAMTCVGCETPQGRRLMRGTHLNAWTYNGSSDSFRDKNDADVDGWAFGVTFDLAALVPEDPIPVYVAVPAPTPCDPDMPPVDDRVVAPK